MAERTTLAALAREVQAIRTRLDEHEQRSIEGERRIRELLGMPKPAEPLRMIPGTAKRRTARRGQLRIVS